MVVLPNVVQAVDVVCAGRGGEVATANRRGELNGVEGVSRTLDIVGRDTDEAIWVGEVFSMEWETGHVGSK